MPTDLTTIAAKQLLRDRNAIAEEVARLTKARATNAGWYLAGPSVPERLAERRAALRAIDAEFARRSE